MTDDLPTITVIETKRTVADLSEEEAAAKLWEMNLVAWKFHEAQLDIYTRLNESKSKMFVINCSRQIGKSFMLCGYAIEFALQHPNCKISYLAPTAKMVKKIILSRMTKLLEDCPKNLKPTYKVNEQIYRFKNGSEIHISGTDSERAENLRGQVFDLVICDEAGFMDRLDYVVSSILMPTTIHTRGKIILSSTPPITNDHPFRNFADVAKLENNYVKKTILDNTMLTKDDVALLMKEAGGPDSVAWRREYLAEFIVDQNEAVIPEATEPKLLELSKYVVPGVDNTQPLPHQFYLPLFYDSYTIADLGYTDNTGILFGYWDYMNAKLVIQDEAVFNRPNTKIIADIIVKKEKELWGDKKPYMRFCDGDLIAISDLNSLHNLHFNVTRNDDLEASVNACRLFVDQNKIVIDPRCVNLLSQLHNATWDNSRRKFKRSPTHGHYDLLAALIYFVRNVKRQKNPYPSNLGLDINTMYVPAENPRQVDNHKTLEKALNLTKLPFKADGNPFNK